MQRPSGEGTRGGHEGRSRGYVTRGSHKGRSRGEVTRKGHEGRSRGEVPRGGHEGRSQGAGRDPEALVILLVSDAAASDIDPALEGV